MKFSTSAILLAGMVWFAPFAAHSQGKPAAAAEAPPASVLQEPADSASADALADSIKREQEAKIEARRAAEAKRIGDAKREREARIAKCQIKPVMTDDEIAYCRTISNL